MSGNKMLVSMETFNSICDDLMMSQVITRAEFDLIKLLGELAGYRKELLELVRRLGESRLHPPFPTPLISLEKLNELFGIKPPPKPQFEAGQQPTADPPDITLPPETDEEKIQRLRRWGIELP